VSTWNSRAISRVFATTIEMRSGLFDERCVGELATSTRRAPDPPISPERWRSCGTSGCHYRTGKRGTALYVCVVSLASFVLHCSCLDRCMPARNAEKRRSQGDAASLRAWWVTRIVAVPCRLPLFHAPPSGRRKAGLHESKDERSEPGANNTGRGNKERGLTIEPHYGGYAW